MLARQQMNGVRIFLGEMIKEFTHMKENSQMRSTQFCFLVRLRLNGENAYTG